MGRQQKILTTWLWGLAVLAMITFVASGLWRSGGGADAQERDGLVVLAADGRDDAKQAGSGELPVLFEAPKFKLIDQDGKQFSGEQLKGSPWIASFIFTNCPGVCPMMFAELAKLQADLPKDVKLVCFSLDPKRDTPEVLKDKAAQLGAQDGRWYFVTGEAEKLDTLTRDMKMPGSTANPAQHSSKFLLLDGAGQCRGVYSSGDEQDMAGLRKDAAALISAKEKRR